MSETENLIDNYNTNEEILKDTKESQLLNELSYKTDTIIYFQEQNYSLSVRTIAIVFVIFIIVILYKYITSFFNF